MTKQRLWQLDALRGLALLNMLAYHAMYDWVYVFGHAGSWYNIGAPGCHVWQQYICWSFILLSGYSFTLARRPLKNGLIVAGCAAVLTVVTVGFMPSESIWFGVLHLNAAAVLLSCLVKPLLDKIPAGPGRLAAGLRRLVLGYRRIHLWRFHASRHAERDRRCRRTRTHLLCLWLYHPNTRAAPRARRDHRLRLLARAGLLCRLLVLPGRRGSEPHRLLWRRPHPNRRHGGNRRASAPSRTWTHPYGRSARARLVGPVLHTAVS